MSARPEVVEAVDEGPRPDRLHGGAMTDDQREAIRVALEVLQSAGLAPEGVEAGDEILAIRDAMATLDERLLDEAWSLEARRAGFPSAAIGQPKRRRYDLKWTT